LCLPRESEDPYAVSRRKRRLPVSRTGNQTHQTGRNRFSTDRNCSPR
jgi:hypothetical protein